MELKIIRTVQDLSFLCHSLCSGMKHCLLKYPAVGMSCGSTHGTAPAWAISPDVSKRFISCFQPKTRLLGCQLKGFGSALFAQFLLWLWSASAPLVWSETTAASLWRGELEFLVKQTCLRLWLLNSPVQMQRSNNLQYPDPTGGLCRARTQLGCGNSSNVSQTQL